MGKVVVSEFITLDGVVEDPGGAEEFDRGGWAFNFDRGPEGDQFKLDEVMASEALLLGRVTYEGFAAAWPSRTDEVGFADKFNSMPKYVVSTTLRDPEWANTTVISDDVAGRIRALKSEPGQDIVQYGFGAVSALLMEHGLLDELRLWIHPLFVAAGTTDDLLFPHARPTHFELVDSTILKSGMAILSYRLA